MSSPIARLGGQVRSPDASPAVVDICDDGAGALVDALGSETARELYAALHDDPAPPSELARELDTSVQNVHYHLSKLQDAEVVEPVGTRLSEKGNEMTVYGPAADPIVLVGNASATRREDLRRTISEWAAGIAVLGLVSLAVQVAAERFLGAAASSPFEPASLGVGDGALVRGIELAAEPGVLFFLGGLVVFAVAGLRGSGPLADD